MMEIDHSTLREYEQLYSAEKLVRMLHSDTEDVKLCANGSIMVLSSLD